MTVRVLKKVIVVNGGTDGDERGITEIPCHVLKNRHLNPRLGLHLFI